MTSAQLANERRRALAGPEYPTEDAVRGDFSFGSNGFLVNGISRDSGKALRRLLFPELMTSKKGVETRLVGVGIITTEWTKAQLKHYGIHHDPDIDSFKAKALLLTSVANGQVSTFLLIRISYQSLYEGCMLHDTEIMHTWSDGTMLIHALTQSDTVPPQILDLKAELRVEIEAMMSDYRAKYKAWHKQQLRERVQQFEACATLTEEVQCDRSLFLHKYFRDKDGDPDWSKTPALMLLPGCSLEDSGLLKGQVSCVPGLHVADAGLAGQDAIIVIGWDRARVNQKARKIDLQQTQGRGIIRSREYWDGVMMEHYEYQEKTQNVGLFAGSWGDFGTSGVFALRSEEIQSDWPILSRQMRMRMFSSGRLGIFDLGIVSGLMILRKTHEDVSRIIEAGTWNVDPDQYLESEDESSDEEENDEDESASISEDSKDDSNDEPEVLDHTASRRPTKRRKGQASESRRLYFQWRGWNTMSGEIQYDPQNRNTGYLDFANNLGTAFEGKIYMELTQGETRFQGFKILGMSGPLTVNWDKLSHLESDRQKVPEHLY